MIDIANIDFHKLMELVRESAKELPYYGEEQIFYNTVLAGIIKMFPKEFKEVPAYKLMLTLESLYPNEKWQLAAHSRDLYYGGDPEWGVVFNNWPSLMSQEMKDKLIEIERNKFWM